jgi:hypothetical protein
MADDSKIATKARCRTRQRAKANLRRKVSMPKGTRFQALDLNKQCEQLPCPDD